PTCAVSPTSATRCVLGRGAGARSTFGRAPTSPSSSRSAASWRGASIDGAGCKDRPGRVGQTVNLLAPKGLWLLTLLAPLVVLYILKIKRQRKRVASVWLWASAQRDLLARAPFRKLVPQVPLLLQAIALAALGVALARPASRGRELIGDHLAIVID